MQQAGDLKRSAKEYLERPMYATKRIINFCRSTRSNSLSYKIRTKTVVSSETLV